MFYWCTDTVLQWIKNCLPRTTIIFIIPFLLKKKERKNNSYWKEVCRSFTVTYFDIFNIVFLLLLKSWWTRFNTTTILWVGNVLFNNLLRNNLFSEVVYLICFQYVQRKKHALRTYYFVPIMSLSGILLNAAIKRSNTLLYFSLYNAGRFNVM